MNANRKKAEQLIYKAFDAIDPSKENSSFYKQMFSQKIQENAKDDIVKEDYHLDFN